MYGKIKATYYTDDNDSFIKEGEGREFKDLLGVSKPLRGRTFSKMAALEYLTNPHRCPISDRPRNFPWANQKGSFDSDTLA